MFFYLIFSNYFSLLKIGRSELTLIGMQALALFPIPSWPKPLPPQT